jgi:hypothetical protein
MRRLSFILTALLMLVSASCQRKVLLEPDHGHGVPVSISVDVEVDVDSEVQTGDDPNMYSDILKTANSITIVAYPRSETAVYSVHKLKGFAGIIWLMPGDYDLLLYTSDFHEVDGIHYRSMEVSHEAEAYTTAVKVSKTKNDVKSYNMEAPDPLFTHFYENYTVVVGENKVSEGLQPMSYKYWFEVDVEGLDYITSAILEIDGMYTSVYMRNGDHREDEYGTQRVETTIHKDENKIRGEFFSFGPHQDSEVKNSMILTFINGRTIRVELDDISPEIKKLTKGGEIVIDQKIVINVGDTGSGFVPEVEGWEEEEVVIPI